MPLPEDFELLDQLLESDDEAETSPQVDCDPAATNVGKKMNLTEILRQFGDDHHAQSIRELIEAREKSKENVKEFEPSSQENSMQAWSSFEGQQ